MSHPNNYLARPAPLTSSAALSRSDPNENWLYISAAFCGSVMCGAINFKAFNFASENEKIATIFAHWLQEK